MEKPPEMSNEQEIIYRYIDAGENVIGDACAGSGKSTTILSIANKIKKNFIQLTYNTMLCNDIKEKIDLYDLSNLRVFTYHSLVVKYYHPKGYTDTFIRHVITNDTPPKTPIPAFDILVLDETQDMTILYFKLVLKFCKDMGKPIQLLILGDYMQGLYDFKGADIRFLTLAKEIWSNYQGLISPVFHHCYLQMSYRITQPMANFVNDVMLGEKRLFACRDGFPVSYIRQPTHFAEKFIIHKIRSLIDSNTAKPNDFFILAASIKGNNSDIRKIENSLVENNIPCYVPVAEDDRIDERVVEGKVMFSTFHSVKGRQRKYVFVIGFNQSYFDFYAKKADPFICPNSLYVACTRATQELIVVEFNNRSSDRPPKFLKKNHVEMKQCDYVDFRGMHQTLFECSPVLNKEKEKKDSIYRTSPSELIRFLPETIWEEIYPILDRIFIPIPQKRELDKIDIEIPNVIKTKHDFYEDISDLNGIALPILYYDHLFSTYKKEEHDVSHKAVLFLNGIKRLIYLFMIDSRQNHHSYLKEAMEKIEEEDIENMTREEQVQYYLKISNLYYAVKEKLYFKYKQIEQDEYTWLNTEMIDVCFRRMDSFLKEDILSKDNIDEDGNNKIRVEDTFIDKIQDDSHRKIDAFLGIYFPNVLFRFSARVDLITTNSVWEIKCSSSITNDHLLQVAIYAWLWRMVMEDMIMLENVMDFKIMNIKTGEHFILNATTEDLNTIILTVLRGKYMEKKIQTREEFIQSCL